MSPDVAKIGIVSVSDRASRGEYEDRGGPAIRPRLDGFFPAISYGVDLIEGPYLTTEETRLAAFRPRKK